MGNIIDLHSSLTNGEEITLFFKSGETSSIRRKSALETCSGDLKIITKIETRVSSNEELYRIVIVDCAEVEKISVLRRIEK